MIVKRFLNDLQSLYYIDDTINNYSRVEKVNVIEKVLGGHKKDFFPLDSSGLFYISEVQDVEKLNDILIKMGLLTKIIENNQIQVYNPGLNTIFLDSKIKM